MPTKQYLTANILYLQQLLTKLKLRLINPIDFKQIKAHFSGKNKIINI